MHGAAAPGCRRWFRSGAATSSRLTWRGTSLGAAVHGIWRSRSFSMARAASSPARIASRRTSSEWELSRNTLAGSSETLPQRGHGQACCRCRWNASTLVARPAAACATDSACLCSDRLASRSTKSRTQLTGIAVTAAPPCPLLASSRCLPAVLFLGRITSWRRSRRPQARTLSRGASPEACVARRAASCRGLRGSCSGAQRARRWERHSE